MHLSLLQAEQQSSLASPDPLSQTVTSSKKHFPSFPLSCSVLNFIQQLTIILICQLHAVLSPTPPTQTLQTA